MNKSTSNPTSQLIPLETIEKKIFLIRGQKVMLDKDLAELYGVTTKRLNEQVRRNVTRFPDDFMFQLSEHEYESLRSHFATLKKGRGKHRKYLPLVFTEQGVAMLSSVLNSERAITVNVAIMRAFVRLRDLLSSNKELARKLEELEKKYDYQFKIVFDAIRKLMNPLEKPVPEKPKRAIGFEIKEPVVKYRARRK
ncbi:MAG: ORF6N domain-containing protein [Bacteroidetes bacterium]|nr:MAG: ORF6N domain-containing protein [Bacteroidota bacterium]